VTPTVRVLAIGHQTVVEVEAATAATLDRLWCQRWAAAGRETHADWCSAGPGYASVRVATDRAAPLLALVDELNGARP